MLTKAAETAAAYHARSKTEETFVNLVLSFCYVLGVDLWPPRSFQKTFNPVLVFRCGSWICLAITAVGNTVTLVQNLGDAPSTLEVIDLFYFLNSMLLLVEAQLSIFRQRQFLNEFCCDNRRFINPKLSLLVTANALYAFVDVSDVFQQKTLLAIISRSSSVVAWELNTLFITLLAVCICILIGQLEEFRLARGLYRVEARKQAIRENVRKVNSIFGTALFLTHLKVFSLMYLVIGGVLSSKNSMLLVLEIACPLVQVFSVYYLAVLGSRVTALCHKTAAEFLGSEEFTHTENPVKTYLILKHVSVQDDIRILDAFSLQSGAFLTFCGTAITYIGVLAQFDYKVMNLLNRSKRQHHAAEWHHQPS